MKPSLIFASVKSRVAQINTKLTDVLAVTSRPHGHYIHLKDSLQNGIKIDRSMINCASRGS